MTERNNKTEDKNKTLDKLSQYAGIPINIIFLVAFIGYILWAGLKGFTGILIGILWFALALRSQSRTVMYLVKTLGAEWYVSELKKRPGRMPRSLKEVKKNQE